MFDKQNLKTFLDAYPTIVGSMDMEHEDLPDLECFDNIENSLWETYRNQTNSIVVQTNRLNTINKVMLSVISWKACIGQRTAMPTAYAPEDVRRVIRLIYEIGLVHLGVIRGDWNKLMTERAREILELTGYTHEYLPLEYDETYTAILAGIGYRDLIKRININSKVYMSPSKKGAADIENYAKNVANYYADLKMNGVEVLGGREKDAIKRVIFVLVKTNWSNLASLDEGWDLYSMGRRWTPAATAEFATKMVSMALPEELRKDLKPWEECPENFKKGMEMLVYETYMYLLTDRCAAPSHAVQRSIRNLTGYTGIWNEPNDVVNKVIAIASVIFEPTLSDDYPKEH